MKYTKAGEIECSHCSVGVSGEVVVSYTLEDDFVDSTFVLHKACVQPFKMARANKVHKCPKCNGTGIKSMDTLYVATKEGRTELVLASVIHQRPGNWYDWKMEKWKETTVPCSLCSGDGYLAKEPIPIITDWKLNA